MAFERIKELFAMLAKLRALFPELSLDQIFALIAKASKLLPLPDLDDEMDCRQWCRELVDVLDDIAASTPVTFDNALLKALATIVENDDAWNVAWDLLSWMTKDDGKVGDTAEGVARNLGAKVGLDPFVILAVIQAVLKFLEWYKSNRGAL